MVWLAMIMPLRADVEFQAGYETGLENDGDPDITVVEPAADRIEATSLQSRVGSWSVRTELQYGDTTPVGSRAESSLHILGGELPVMMGLTRFYGFSIRLDPDNFAYDSNGDILFQIKNGDSQPSFHLMTDEGQFKFSYHNNDNPTTVDTYFTTYQKGIWYDFVLEILPEYTSTGYMKFYYKKATDPNYTQVLDYTGSTLLQDRDAYFKWGVYKATWATAPTESTIRVVYHDNVTVGTTFADASLPDSNGNALPTFTADPIITSDVTDGVAYSDTLDGSATDADSDPLTYSKVSGPAWLSVASGGALSGTPGTADVGPNSWTVQVDDGNGGTETATLQITVNAAEGSASDDFQSNSWSGGTGWSGGWDVVDLAKLNPPEIVLLSGNYCAQLRDGGRAHCITRTLGGIAGGTLTFTWDIDSMDSVTEFGYAEVFDGTWHTVWSMNNSGNGADANASPDNLQLETIDLSAYGTVTQVRFFTSANTGSGDYLYVDDVSIIGGSAPANNAPVFTADLFSKPGATEDVSYSGTIAGSATDADSDPLTYSKAGGPTWLAVASSGALSGTPGTVDLGTNSWSVQVFDGNGGTDSAILKIAVVVAPVNQAPAFTADPISKANGDENVAYSGSVAGDASDPEADPLTFSKVAGPAWLSIAANGTLSGTPAAGDVGLNVFTVQVSAVGGSDTATLNITVDAAPSGPAFTDNFESSADWTSEWISYGAWARTTARQYDGSYSAEIDGSVTDSALVSRSIDVTGKSSVTITFWWYIEKGLDTGEYLAFDTDTGSGWVEKATRQGNVDQEDTWASESIVVDVSGTNTLTIRFRGKMSDSREDAYVDQVEVIAQ